jgi:hypothetical protein
MSLHVGATLAICHSVALVASALSSHETISTSQMHLMLLCFSHCKGTSCFFELPFYTQRLRYQHHHARCFSSFEVSVPSRLEQMSLTGVCVCAQRFLVPALYSIKHIAARGDWPLLIHNHSFATNCRLTPRVVHLALFGMVGCKACDTMIQIM